MFFFSFFASFALLQIDDVDVQRCREGRLEYLGMASFLVIAIPITFLLINEAIGGAVMDAAIPAFYFAALMALLVPLLAIAAICLYTLFIYRPSFKAYNRRCDKLNRSHADSTNRRNRSVRRAVPSGPRSGFSESFRYLHRVYTIVKCSLQDSVTMLSTKSLDNHRKKRLCDSIIWRNMNKYVVIQDLTLESQKLIPLVAVITKEYMVSNLEQLHNDESSSVSYDEFDQYKRSKQLPSGHSLSDISFSEINPSKTSFMLSLKVVREEKEDEREVELKGKFEIKKNLPFQYPIEIATMTSSRDSEKKRINTTQEIQNIRKKREIIHFMGDEVKVQRDESIRCRAAMKQMNPTFISTLEEAITIIHKNLSASSLSVLYGQSKVQIKDLSLEFEKMLPFFHPDSIPMSELELNEVHEKFTEWKNEINSRRSLTDLPIAGDGSIDFETFERWFSTAFEFIHNIADERLLAYTLRQMLVQRGKNRKGGNS